MVVRALNSFTKFVHVIACHDSHFAEENRPLGNLAKSVRLGPPFMDGRRLAAASRDSRDSEGSRTKSEAARCVEITNTRGGL